MAVNPAWYVRIGLDAAENRRREVTVVVENFVDGQSSQPASIVHYMNSMNAVDGSIQTAPVYSGIALRFPQGATIRNMKSLCL